MNGTYP